MATPPSNATKATANLMRRMPLPLQEALAKYFQMYPRKGCSKTSRACIAGAASFTLVGTKKEQEPKSSAPLHRPSSGISCTCSTRGKPNNDYTLNIT
jgi:hypothetical protein